MSEVTIIHNDGRTETYEDVGAVQRDNTVVAFVDSAGAEVIISLTSVAQVRIT